MHGLFHRGAIVDRALEERDCLVGDGGGKIGGLDLSERAGVFTLIDPHVGGERTDSSRIDGSPPEKTVAPRSVSRFEFDGQQLRSHRADGFDPPERCDIPNVGTPHIRCRDLGSGGRDLL
jgi:hypothetical protein